MKSDMLIVNMKFIMCDSRGNGSVHKTAFSCWIEHCSKRYLRVDVIDFFFRPSSCMRLRTCVPGFKC